MSSFIGLDEVQPIIHAVCPRCGTKGKKVDSATVKALVVVSLREVQAGEYRFCSQAECAAVYYHTSSDQLFLQQHLRERVYQKEPTARDVLICYCFQHRLGEVLDSLPIDQAQAIVEDVNQGIQAGQCACDWRNPQGACCLGNIQRLIADDKQRHSTT